MVNEKNQFSKFVKYLSIGLAVVLMIVLIVVKVRSPEFNIWIFVVGLIVAGGFVVFVIFGSSIWNSARARPDDSILPPPITDDEAYRRFESYLQSTRYANWPKKIIEEGSETIGEHIKSDIYTIIIEGVYPDEENKTIQYVGIINKHYPDHKRKLLINPSKGQISQMKELLASQPSRKPNVEVSTMENPMTGTTLTTRKETYEEDKPKKEENTELV